MADGTWKSWLDGQGNGRAAISGHQGRVRITARNDCSLTPDEALDFADAVAEAAAIQGTMLGSIGPDNKGGWTVEMQPSPGLTRRMVTFLCEWLGPAENYTETKVDLPFDLPADSDRMQMSPKPAGQVRPYVLTVERAGGKTPHEKRLEAEAERDKLSDILGNLWLYVDWRWLTKQLTTEEKEIWASAVEAWSAALNEGSDEDPVVADRWWLCPTCGINIRSLASDGPHESCAYALAGDDADG